MFPWSCKIEVLVILGVAFGVPDTTLSSSDSDAATVVVLVLDVGVVLAEARRLLFFVVAFLCLVVDGRSSPVAECSFHSIAFLSPERAAKFRN